MAEDKEPTSAQLDKFFEAFGFKVVMRDCIGIMMYETPQRVIIYPDGLESREYPRISMDNLLHLAEMKVLSEDLSISIVMDGYAHQYHAYLYSHEFSVKTHFEAMNYTKRQLALFWLLWQYMELGEIE